MRVKFCRSCGRLGFFNFVFCPWCGEEYEEKPDGEEIVGRAVDRLEPAAKAGAAERFERLERSLAAMDRDLEEFILSDDEAGRDIKSLG